MRSIAKLCESLVSDGSDLLVLTTTANGDSELIVRTDIEYSIAGVRVRYHHRWTKDHTHFSPGLLLRTLRLCRRYDVVHIHSWWNLVSVLACLACLLRGTRPVVTLRGTLSDHTFKHNHTRAKRFFHKIVGRLILRNAALHVTSQKEYQEVCNSVPGAKCWIIPNILHLTFDQVAIEDRDESILRLLFVGRVHPIKNLELMLQALLLTGEQFHVRLDILGDGESTYLNYLKEKYQQLNQVYWHGNVDGKKKLTFMQNADTLVLLSHTENFGNVVLEALSQGTSVLVARNVGISEYIRKNNLGWVIDSDIDQCVSVLGEIHRSQSFRKDVRRRAPELVAQEFAPAVLTQQYRKLYAELSRNDHYAEAVSQ